MIARTTSAAARPRVASHLDPVAANDRRGEAFDGVATVVAVDAGRADHLEVRRASGVVEAARRGFVAGWVPTEGDRVLVARADGEVFVVGVITARAPAALTGPDGSRATLVDGAIELRDGAGRLLARSSAAETVIEAATGDLVLRAPQGRVRVEAGVDLELAAARDVRTEAARDLSARAERAVEITAGRPDPQLRIDARRTEIAGETVDLRAKAAEIAAGTIALVARSFATKALEARHDVSRWELHAGSLVERARESLREVKGLAEVRAGRARTLVRELHAMRAGRTEVVSEQDTVIDGRKVLLG